MRLRQGLLWANGGQKGLRNVRGRDWPIWAFILLFLIGGSAEAQFSGPALGASSPVNVPVIPTIDQTILYPPGRDIKLGEGDLLTIHLYGAPDYAPPVRVSLDGSIQLPLIGVVRVEDLTIQQAEKVIAERLKAAGMYRDPQVTIQLTESPNQSVTVTGEIHGIVPVPGEKRLFDVLAAVGGLPPTASHTLTINRPGVPQPIVVDLGTNPMLSKQANVPVFAKDTVIVSRVGAIYLLGAFRIQGAIPIQQNSPLTLMQVAAIGGGPGFEGKYNDLRIIRSAGLERKVVQVDIKKVINGKEPDPVLEADDIVFLPTDPMKAAIKSGGISTLMGIASILILAVRQ